MNIVRVAVEYVSAFLEMALVSYFCSSFQAVRFSKKTRIFIYLLISLLYGSFVVFLPTGNIMYTISIIATFAMTFCYKFKWYNAVFAALAFSVISALAELVTMRIVTLGGQSSFEEVNANIYVYLCGLFSSKMITFLFTIIVHKKNYKSFQSVKGTRFVALTMLPCSSIIMSMVYSHLLLQYPINNFLEILSITALIFLFVSNTMIFYIVDRQHELISSKEKLKMNEILLEHQKKYYEDVFQSQQEIRKTRHDLKNIFIALSGALNSGDTVECKKIIQSKLDELEQHIDVSSKADSMLDSILYSKVKKAQSFNVNLCTKKNINRPIEINQLDLAILVANILDNAVEAASVVEKNKEVSFSILTDQDSLIILSQNSTVNPFVNENTKTTKKDKKRHGFGMMSIKSITEKYNGNYSMEYNDGLVTVTVVLTNQKPL